MSPTEVDLHLRPVRRDDPEEAAAVARVHLRARAGAPMPPPAHSAAEVRDQLASRLASGSPDEVWVAETGDPPVLAGYLRMTPTWIDDLYVDPAHARRGVGSVLLDLAKSLRPGGFGLWVFAVNAPARAFYARHGLVEVEYTDGSANEEREPDVALRWEP